MTLHKYAAIHGTTREQEAEYHLPTPPPTEEEIEEERKFWEEVRELKRLFSEEEEQ